MKKPKNLYRKTTTACSLIILSLSSHLVQAQSPPIPGAWTLEFEDNFVGNDLDGNKWRVGGHYAGIAGAAANVPEQISVGGGALRITASTADGSFSGSNKNYSSGEVSTFGNFRQKEGYWEARIKYPAVQGLWPAFWLMPDRADYGWSGNYYRSCIKFNLTGVNPGSISSAELRLKPSSVQSGGEHNLLVMGASDDSWTETGVNWNNMPTPDPLFLAQRYNNLTAGSTISLDVKNFVTEEMNGDKILTFVLTDSYMRDKKITFHSSEASNSSDRPSLVINGQTYYANADASVRKSEPTNNINSAELSVEDGWGNTADTYNGGMEIDIMESLGKWGANQTQHALHWDGYGGSHQYADSGRESYPGTSDGYHTYGLYWADGAYEFYIDGIKTWQWTNSRAMSVPAYLLLSLQLGGWDNNNPGSQVEGQVMLVDYVRVWSGTKSAGGGLPTAGNYRIKNKHSSLFLRPKNSGTGEEVPIIQWTDEPTYNSEKWEVIDVGGGYYAIENIHTRKAMLPLGGSTSNNASVVQKTYSGWDSQRWQFLDSGDGYVRIKSKRSGLYLRPESGSTSTNAYIVQHDFNASWSSLKWTFEEQ